MCNLRNNTRILFSIVLSIMIASSMMISQIPYGKEIITKYIAGIGEVEYMDGIVVIKVKPTVNEEELLTNLNKVGYKILKKINDQGWGVFEIPPGNSIFTAADALKMNSLIQNAIPLIVHRPHFLPNDPYFCTFTDCQWGLLYYLDMMNAWDLTMGNPNITVGVLDYGIPIEGNQLSHLDLDEPDRIILGNDYR